MKHELKTWPEHFDATWAGKKTFEIRLNDRDFKVGDVLKQRRFDPETETFNGDYLMRRVTYVLHGGQFGLADGYVCMSLDIWFPQPGEEEP